MPLVTGKMKDILLGSTDVQLVLLGSTVVWERDHYPQVVWPEDYFYPRLEDVPTWGNQNVMFFIPSTGSTSVSYGVHASDCEGEGGGPALAYLLGEEGVVAKKHFGQGPITADTGNLWLLFTDSYELYLDQPGNIFTEYNSKGMIISGGYNSVLGSEGCPSYTEINSGFTEQYPNIEFFGIEGEYGNTDVTIVTGGTDILEHYFAYYDENSHSPILDFTSLKWFFTEDTHWDIPLYMSSAFTEESMQFTVKNSRNATFIVDDNAYWRSIIPWDMAAYYNVTFKTRSGEIIDGFRSGYLTIECDPKDNNFITFHCDSGTSIEISTNGGRTWSPYTRGNVAIYLGTGRTSPAIFMFRGVNDTIDFSVCSEGKVYGNVLSLFYGDDFKDKTSFPSTASTINGLFQDYYAYGHITDASNVYLPPNITPYCYQDLFRDNIMLTKIPKLNTTALTEGCYKGMFRGCRSLTTAPELPHTTLYAHCYEEMFRDCSGLTSTQSVLPAAVLPERCYYGMFQNCSSLTTAPTIMGTELSEYCCNNMFNGCTSLVSVQSGLPATVMAEYCYYGMYKDCSSLATAPELPSTALARYCYCVMFQNCTSLVRAPELPSASLPTDCYYRMFNGCSNLNYIKCLKRGASSGTGNWVYGVSPTGTFVKYPNSYWTTGSSGIPDGWTVIEDT